MKQQQRRENDKATTERREMTDKTVSNSRDRNDEATAERRAKSDKVLEDNRERNDEATAERRDVVDEKRTSRGILALLLFGVIALEVIIIFNLI